MPNTRAKICLRTTEVPDGVKVMQIVPYSAGGFAVLAPYHVARRGWLLKHRVDYTRSEDLIARSELVVEYDADDRVKLSIHPDGFVQFSGEDPAKITSGRDPETGEAKGLGLLMQQPLREPIETGPTFGMTIWGLTDFAPIKRRDVDEAYVFTEADLYLKEEDLPASLQPAYVVEGFVLPRAALKDLLLRAPRESVIRFFHPGFQWRGGEIDLRFVDLPGQEVLLGIMVSRAPGNEEGSGFSLHSPSDMTSALMAIYPAPEGAPAPASLSRQVEAEDGTST